MSRPRLFWAISHQKLRLTEVPALEAAGFDVVTEDPESSSMGFLDAIDLPELGNRASQYAAVRSMRLWARDGLVTDQEAAFVNEHFDAIMIQTRLKVAVNVRSWFQGTVFYRQFGENGALFPDPHFDVEDADLSRIIYVPLLSSLLNDSFASRFQQSLLLRTAMVLPPIADSVTADPHGPLRVGVFVALLDDVEQVFRDIKQLALSIPNVKIDVFGLNLNEVRQIPALPSNVVIMRRLNDTDYWQQFRNLTIVIYPHENPRHSHYIPYESIALGIPCLVTRASTIASDFAANGIGEGEDSGIFPTVAAILDAVPRLLNSDQSLAAIAKQQLPVLEAFSADTIREEATRLVAAVACSRRSSGSDSSQALQIEPGMKIPSRIVRGDLEHFRITGSLILNPSTIAVSTKLGLGISGEVVFGDGDGPVLDLIPGVPNQMRLGMPAYCHDGSIACRLSVRTRASLDWPAAVFVSKSGEFVEIAFSHESRVLANGDVCWDAFITISPSDEVVVSVMTDEILDRIRVVEVELKVLTEAQWLQAIVGELRYEVASLKAAAATADIDHTLTVADRDRAVANLVSTEAELRSSHDWADGLERQLHAILNSRTWRLRRRFWIGLRH